jgi:hypothetical protein
MCESPTNSSSSKPKSKRIQRHEFFYYHEKSPVEVEIGKLQLTVCDRFLSAQFKQIPALLVHEKCLLSWKVDETTHSFLQLRSYPFIILFQSSVKGSKQQNIDFEGTPKCMFSGLTTYIGAPPLNSLITTLTMASICCPTGHRPIPITIAFQFGLLTASKMPKMQRSNSQKCFSQIRITIQDLKYKESLKSL